MCRMIKQLPKTIYLFLAVKPGHGLHGFTTQIWFVLSVSSVSSVAGFVSPDQYA